ncbi:FtsQ-type POTRA domain-containing protein [uncultured Anaerococcus sp.]|uniref:cell division protein FtsQ/DivIB n=1 Tax=uncultured Anaerococcus sp. TaxID=293428 RepID=UPI00288924E8|nr:FtsQ-type POTRA domain-containing protein [uncultured Anaerococcus sp.]
MTNKNDDRLIKKGSRVFNKQYIAKKHSKEVGNSKLFIFALFLAFLLGVLYNVYTHPYMKIQDIYINGNRVTDDTEIIKKLKSPLGKNILLYNPKKYEKDIKSLEYIRSAKVRKVFPKILSVKVEEDFPMFEIKKHGKKILITNNGLITDEKPKSKEAKFIEIKASNIETTIGKSFTSSKAIQDFIEQLQASSLIGSVSQLNLENKLDIGIMIQGIEVKFGDLNNISFKIKLLEKTLQDIKNKGLEAVSINLNNGDNPIVVVK